LNGYISATSVTDIFYILQKARGKEDARIYLQKLLKVVKVAGVDQLAIFNALYADWPDFEDAVQAQVAINHKMDAIITRNTKDFRPMKAIKVLSPSDFIQKFGH
jgi:predicted nucleic acid-binding protein